MVAGAELPGNNRGVLQPDEEASLIATRPEDATDIRAYCLWLRRKEERVEAIQTVRTAVEAASRLRRLNVLKQVVADLERQKPGWVRKLVSAHNAGGHTCSMAEHDARDMV